MASVIVLGAGSASAATSFTENFDEDVGLTSGNYTTVNAIGVFTSNTHGIEIQNNYPGLTPAASLPQLVELDTDQNSSMFTNIEGGVYTLTFDYSPRPGVAASSSGINVLLGDLLLGTYAEDGTGLSATAFSTKTINFTTLTGGALTFAATGTSDSLGGFLDNVNLSGVPEPASWAMMIGGFGLVGGAMRRRRAQAGVAFA